MLDDESYVEADDELSSDYQEIGSDDGEAFVTYDREGRAVELEVADLTLKNNLLGGTVSYAKAIGKTIRGSRVWSKVIEVLQRWKRLATASTFREFRGWCQYCLDCLRSMRQHVDGLLVLMAGTSSMDQESQSTKIIEEPVRSYSR